MDSNTLHILEYQAALEWLAEETHSEAGRLAALSLSPDLSPEEISGSWSLIGEGREILNQGGGPDLGDHLDLTVILEPLKVEGAMLDVEELRAVGLEARCVRAAQVFFASPLEIAPGLCAMAARLTAFPDLAEAIERTIGPDGEILDTASPELARLRLEAAATRQGLTAKLTGLMRSDGFRHLVRDELITTRSDRFVVPVRASAAGQKRGLVHDWSKTGATAFLEPLEAVEDNNRLGFLKRKEKAEIERILRRLSEACRAAAPELLVSGGILTRLDVIMAQARLARAWNAVRPEYKPGEGLSLRQARHPLLARRLKSDGRQMTPLDLVVEPGKPIVVISGLNTGGKTVAMKTLGLNILLAKTGLPLPAAEGSRLDFPEVLAVMGDEQDLSSDLSTFSGHVRSLQKILSEARPGLLVLLDEIGSGTDPAEGAALGLAVLEKLAASGALVMAATHYQLIKTWAALNEAVVSAAVNSSDSGQPLYGLSYGSPGFSGGLKMARRLGLAEDLVQKAEGYLEDGQRKAMELLAKLDEERSALIRTREEFEENKLALARAEAELRERNRREAEDFAKRAQAQNKSITEALAAARREFEELKSEMRAAIAGRDSSKQVAFSERKAALDKRLRAARPESPNAAKPLAEVREGDLVLVGKLGREAVVRSVGAEGHDVWVDMGGLNVKVARRDLFAPAPPEDARPAAPKSARTVQITVTPAASFGLEINLLGQTVEEAVLAIEKEIDRAALSGQKNLHVIHGYGTGRLRNGVRGFLRSHPRVRHFERAPQNAGGDGVTVVTLE